LPGFGSQETTDERSIMHKDLGRILTLVLQSRHNEATLCDDNACMHVMHIHNTVLGKHKYNQKKLR